MFKGRVQFSTDGQLIVPRNFHPDFIETFVDIEDEIKQREYRECIDCLTRAGLTL